jgi:hypothetical protein
MRDGGLLSNCSGAAAAGRGGAEPHLHGATAAESSASSGLGRLQQREFKKKGIAK